MLIFNELKLDFWSSHYFPKTVKATTNPQGSCKYAIFPKISMGKKIHTNQT
jgi:hypothetical protein